ncbi:MAG TPA: MAPEG family protein [Polyangia bacterium]|nr:MAPEG family protein [Polyangia bacterium]
MTAAQGLAARALLVPILALVGLTYSTAAAILVTRLSDILSRGNEAAFYEDYAGGGPPAVRRMTSQLVNLFEFPVLFLAVVCLAVACGFNDRPLRELAWAYVVLRWAHAIIRITPKLNRLWLRTPIFMLSNFVLLAMWIELTLKLAR